MVSISEEEFREHNDAFDGLCLECGDWSFGGVEPDAEGYKCAACGAMKVMGAENALILGHVDIE